MSQKLKANAAALAAHVGRSAPMPPSDAATASDGALSPLAEFSRQLAQRFPETLVQRFVMPTTIKQCREVFFREVTSADEVEAAIYADQTASQIEKASVRLMNDAENREVVRLAIVGFGSPGPSGAMAYEHVNVDGIPLERINSWPQKAWAALRSYFGQINGVPVSEIREGIEGAQIVGAFAPPTSATLADHGDGK